VVTGAAAGGNRQRWLVLALVLAVALGLPAARPVVGPYAYVLQVTTVVFMWIALASSWNIIGGFAGYISLGHNVFLAVGAYFAAWLLLFHGVSPFWTFIGAGVVSSALGLVVGTITLRTRGPAFIISTIALMLIAQILLDNWDYLGGTNGITLPLLILDDPSLLPVPFYYAMLGTAMGAVLLAYRVRHSKFGLGLRAIAEDEIRAEMAGIDTRLLKIVAFAVSGFFIGVAGAFWGYSLSYLRPEIFLTIGVAANMVLMAVIGGRGTIVGPIIGAILIVVFNETAVSKFGSTELNIAVTGTFLVAALLFFPQGIVGTLKGRGWFPRALDWG
jgi:branched-chain amino acid transport system permease protein